MFNHIARSMLPLCVFPSEPVEECRQLVLHHRQRSDCDSSSSLSFKGFSDRNSNPRNCSEEQRMKLNDRKREAEREREREPGAGAGSGKRCVEVTQLVYFPLPSLDIYNKRVSDPRFKFQTHPAPLYNFLHPPVWLAVKMSFVSSTDVLFSQNF